MTKEEKLTILSGGFVVTMNERRQILKNGSLVISNDKIREIGPTEDILGKYWDKKAKRISCRGHMILPGCVNTHIHCAQSLVRGIAEDMGRAPSYTSSVPQGDDFFPDQSYLFGMLGAATALRYGSTTISDNYACEAEEAKAFQKLGIRAVVSERVHDMDFHYLSQEKYVKDPGLGEELLQKNIDLLEKYSNPAGRITAAVGIHAADTCSREFLKKVRRETEKYQVPTTLHLSQSLMENRQIREKYNMTPTQLLEDCGFLNENLMAAHCMNVSEDDIRQLAHAGAQIVHIPEGNAKSGRIAPVSEMRDAGLNIAIGTDNGGGNMLENMRMALISERIRKASIPVSWPMKVLEMATIGGARALHMDDKIGSLEEGKKADIITVRFDSLHMTPAANAVGTLVHMGCGTEIDLVMVNGKILVEDGHLTSINEEELIRQCSRQASEMWRRADPEFDDNLEFLY